MLRGGARSLLGRYLRAPDVWGRIGAAEYESLLEAMLDRRVDPYEAADEVVAEVTAE